MALPILVSAILFYLAFPNIFFLQGFSPFAWIFAIPLFVALEQKNLVGRFTVGFLFGLLSNLAAVNWMIPYSFPGYILLSLALTSQAVFFAILYPSTSEKKNWQFLYVPCAWVAAEVLRKFLMMGQSWDLAHSQSFDTPLLQMVKLFGSAGLSFSLILINVLIYQIIFFTKDPRHKRGVIVITICFLLSVYGYGFYAIEKNKPGQQTSFKICVIQPNIDYHGELSDARIEQITNAYILLSKEAVKNSKPDLIVWPETAIPTDFLADPLLKAKIIDLVKEVDTSFLIGAAIEDENGVHNSAVFLDRNGMVQSIYYKRHLIPLTEFVPPSPFWKAFAKFFNVDSPNLVPGTQSGMMEITSRTNGAKIHFGVAICSEDNVAQVFRQYANDGEGFVIVLLNNGWFSQKEGLVMHAEHSMMHAAENQMPVIRVANTGLSGLIDSTGHLSSDSLNSLKQKRFFQYEVAPKSSQKLADNLVDTFCLLCIGFVILMQLKVLFLKGRK